MAKFTWQDGTLVSKAKVEVGGTIYEVDPEEYSGATPLSASNLNAMQDGIYEDLGDKSRLKTNNKTDLVNAINSIVDGEAYSTDEIKTNELWIDGKPIYMREKIFELTATGATSYDISDYNIDTLVDMRPLFVRTGNNTDIELPYVYNTNDDMARLFIRNNTSIEVRYQIGSGYPLTKVRCLLKYTKTTD